jgi:hypothetical protein
MPPTGAFGGNTGIHDAHNLAWKLAAVLRGNADPVLLDSYDPERRPVAEASLEQALARLQTWFKDPSKRLPPPVPLVDDYDVVFRHIYHAGAVITEGEIAGRAFANARELSGQPGSRAPHLVIERDGRRMSTLDLFNKDFVLLTGVAGTAWCEATRALADRGPYNRRCYRVGAGGDLIDVENRWPAAYGVTESGAVLVRPDGFVAWRSRDCPSQPSRVLSDIFARIGFRISPETF